MIEEEIPKDPRWEQIVCTARNVDAGSARAPEGFSQKLATLRSGSDTAWHAVAEAARAGARDSHPHQEAAPYGFATRTVARWRGVRRTGNTLLWERWTLRAGAASLGLCAVLAILPPSGDEMLIPVPEIEFALS